MLLKKKKIEEIPDLYEKLERNSYEFNRIGDYFSGFENTTKNSFCDHNNFGQDLRSLLESIELGIKYNSKTVFFVIL